MSTARKTFAYVLIPTRLATKAQPELWELLDVGLAEMTRIDCTYSIKCANPDILRQTIKQMGNVSNRYIKPARNSDFETTLYFTVLPRRIREQGHSNCVSTPSMMKSLTS